mmetsp:Transcript_69160/g.184314  ORF Transcript_69160/g.184314 Transcript_69160/m.184314 type:complete len:132 (-) Transcript_69160:271-666(-)
MRDHASAVIDKTNSQRLEQSGIRRPGSLENEWLQSLSRSATKEALNTDFGFANIWTPGEKNSPVRRGSRSNDIRPRQSSEGRRKTRNEQNWIDEEIVESVASQTLTLLPWIMCLLWIALIIPPLYFGQSRS